MKFKRAGGILLHPTSLPSPYGIGDLGTNARKFVDFLVECGLTLWQVLPLGPTGFGNSPYASYSAFAGNALLLSLDQFVKEGWLQPADLAEIPDFPADRVDYDAAVVWKERRLKKAFETFQADGNKLWHQSLIDWSREPLNAAWLEDFALFMAIKGQENGEPFSHWPTKLRSRHVHALHAARSKLEHEIWYHRFLQWQFDRQWQELQSYAKERDVELVGDIPIYVAEDSADVWSHPELFHLDDDARPTVVGGVPPDYFSKTGQLWGNPLYRWDAAASEGYGWWQLRFQVLFSRVDRVRLDHFRGFEAYWEIPAGAKTAVGGRWAEGPGAALFRALQRSFGELAILAEDLGVITPEVETLRDEFEFPGMKILQFAFGSGAGNAYLPHNFSQNCVVYTGTHDNDTTAGWISTLTVDELTAVQQYLGLDHSPIAWNLVRLCMASTADTCIIPMQDLLELGSSCRMNTPSTEKGNWQWRYQPSDITGGEVFASELAAKVREVAEMYGRAEPRAKNEQKTQAS